jgi:hypothetical protein
VKRYIVADELHVEGQETVSTESRALKKTVTSEQQLSIASQTSIWCTDILQPTARSLMQAIRPIIEIYVKLQNEAALLALKKQRLKVLATCYPNDPIFAKLRRQCREVKIA